MTDYYFGKNKTSLNWILFRVLTRMVNVRRAFLICFVVAASIQAQDCPPFFKVGAIIRFKADGLKTGYSNPARFHPYNYRILEINGKWVHLEQDETGGEQYLIDALKQKGMLASAYSDIGWFSVDKMSNILEVK